MENEDELDADGLSPGYLQGRYERAVAVDCIVYPVSFSLCSVRRKCAVTVCRCGVPYLPLSLGALVGVATTRTLAAR